MAFIDTLKATGVVAVIRGSSADEAVAMSEALLRGGVTGIEITYSTPDCCAAIQRVAATASETGAVVGVGTVRSVDQLLAARDAGATFAVSPHFDRAIVSRAVQENIPMLPGAITPTEVVTAFDAGATVIKIFPGSLVGPSYLKALRGPLPDIPLMPTGGVSVENMGEWFEAGAVAVGMGGKLASGTPATIEAAAAAVSNELALIR